MTDEKRKEVLDLFLYDDFKNSNASLHIPQELRIRSRGTERHSASN